MDSIIDELSLEIYKLSQQRKCRPNEVLREYISEGRVKRLNHNDIIAIIKVNMEITIAKVFSFNLFFYVALVNKLTQVDDIMHYIVVK